MPFLIRRVKVKFHRIAALCLSDCQDHVTPSVAKAMGNRTISHILVAQGVSKDIL